VGDETPGTSGPLLVGGFAYSDAPVDESGPWRDFAAGSLTLPAELWVRDGDTVVCCVTAEIAPGSDAKRSGQAFEAAIEAAERALAAGAAARESEIEGVLAPEYCAAADRAHGVYCDAVAQALRAIARGEFEKVVLARSLRVRCANGSGYDCARLLRTLRREQPSCTIFGLARPRAGGEGESIFLGATPELLARVERGSAELAAVAGSAARGRNPSEDAAFASALLESKKEQAEHAIVVRAIEDALAPIAVSVERAEAPELLRLEGLQHLSTPVRAELHAEAEADGECGVLGLVERLHPTPAVGGSPRAEAQRWIDAHEDLERGWYAGPVGYVDMRGDGEFQVALRSAIVRGPEAHLYAGAGIVAGSQPESELAETRMKLRALLAPLTEI
jgi:isochorismate synthase